MDNTNASNSDYSYSNQGVLCRNIGQIPVHVTLCCAAEFFGQPPLPKIQDLNSCKSYNKEQWSRLNALSVTFDFFGESDWGSDWTKMDNVTLYYSIIILCNLGAKPNFLIWDDKE